MEPYWRWPRKTRSGYGRMKWVESEEEKRERLQREQQAEAERFNREAGFKHPIGEELMVRCDKVNKKGNSSFTIEGREARFDPALKVEEGTEVLARIVRTEMKPKKAYILERVQKD